MTKCIIILKQARGNTFSRVSIVLEKNSKSPYSQKKKHLNLLNLYWLISLVNEIFILSVYSTPFLALLDEKKQKL